MPIAWRCQPRYVVCIILCFHIHCKRNKWNRLPKMTTLVSTFNEPPSITPHFELMQRFTVKVMDLSGKSQKTSRQGKLGLVPTSPLRIGRFHMTSIRHFVVGVSEWENVLFVKKRKAWWNLQAFVHSWFGGVLWISGRPAFSMCWTARNNKMDKIKSVKTPYILEEA